MNDSGFMENASTTGAQPRLKWRLFSVGLTAPWVLGGHRIGCGDCRDSDFLAKVVGIGQQVDAAFLDPPYNVSIQSHANVRAKHREFAMASGEMNDTEFECFLVQTLGACAGVSRNGAVHFVCMDWRHDRHLQHAGDQVYDNLLNLCVWNKSNAGMGSLYRSKHELPVLTWVMFLKFLDDLERMHEDEAALAGEAFHAAIEPPYRWRDWAAQRDGITGPDLLSFINGEEAMRFPCGARSRSMISRQPALAP